MSHHRCACKSSYSSLGTSRETRGCILFTVLREYSIRQGRFPLFGHVSRSRPSTISQCAHRSTSSPYICRHGEVRGAGGWVCFSSQSSFFKPFSRTGTGKPVKSCTWIRRIPSDSSVGPVRRTRGVISVRGLWGQPANFYLGPRNSKNPSALISNKCWFLRQHRLL